MNTFDTENHVIQVPRFMSMANILSIGKDLKYVVISHIDLLSITIIHLCLHD